MASLAGRVRRHTRTLALLLVAVNAVLIWLFSRDSFPWLSTYACVDAAQWQVVRSRFGELGDPTNYLRRDFVFLFTYPLLTSLLCAAVARRLVGPLASLGGVLTWVALLSIPIDGYETASIFASLPDGIPASRAWLTCTAYKLKAIPVGLAALYVVLAWIGIHRVRISTVLRYLYFLRIPIFIFFGLLAFPLAAANLTIKGLLTTNDAVQLGIVTSLLGLTAANVVFAARTILNLGHIRFDVPRIRSVRARSLPTVLMALVFVAFLYRLWQNTYAGTGDGLLGILIGLGLIAVFVTRVVRSRRWIANAPDWLNRLGPGYVDGLGHFRPGHPLAVAAAAVLLVIYVFGYYLLEPFDSSWQVPSIAYVFLILMLLTTILAGLTFFFDRYRVPVLLAFILYTMANYRVLDIDHFFPVELTESKRPTIEEAFKARIGDRKPKMIAVVCASGGGIWSAAWTTRVLTGLQDTLRTGFAESIYLTSSTSGGSAGLYFYLNAFDQAGSDTEKLDRIARTAAASSLEATAWGLAYPDFARLVFPYVFFNPLEGLAWEMDRAWAIEQMWERNLRDSLGVDYDSLSGWAGKAASGAMPGVVYNTTIAENGGLNVVSTLDLREVAPPRRVATLDSLYVPPEHYGRLNVDLSTTTAARLSATFPYVTPISRAYLQGERTATLDEWHLADGGYFDNFGVVAATFWIDHVIEHDLVDNDVEFMIIQIRASSPGAFEAKPDQGWLYAIAGPIKTVMGVWSTSQSIRNDFEIELLQERHRKNGADRVHTVIIQPVEEKVPLSWFLSREDKQSIQDEWDRWLREHGDDLAMLRRLVE